MRPRLNAADVAMLTVVAALVFAAMLATAAGHAATVHWHKTGASTFGGSCQPSERVGYRGDYLPRHPQSFAELGAGGLIGNALGSMPHNTRIRVLLPSTHRRLNLLKRDIGRGGGDVSGYHRSIDIYGPALTRLLGHRSCTWTGVVLWRAVP